MEFGYFTLSDNHYPGNQRSANQLVMEIREQAILADKLGMHSAWIGEHHFDSLGVNSRPVKAGVPASICLPSALLPQLMLLGSICVALNTLVDVMAVFANRLLKSGVARPARARPLQFQGKQA